MDTFRFINIGFGNTVNAGKIIAIVSPDSAPVKRLVAKAREDGRTVDATQGRKTKAVLIMENDRVVLSALLPETIRARAQGTREGAAEAREGEAEARANAAEAREDAAVTRQDSEEV